VAFTLQFFAAAGLAQRDRAPATVSGHQYTGPGSCSSSSCHGSVFPRTENRVLQNEYSTWVLKDKHSKAYSVLAGEVGKNMARILQVRDPQMRDPQKAVKCLACHALPVPENERGRTFDLSDGVSCESCHGPASAWLGPHTTRDWTHEKSLALGMYETRDLVMRTQKCLTCHLGNSEKFVDHEMLAAGHPDLYFELATFSSIMPRHWKNPGEPQQYGTLDPLRGVREWSTGQAVQLQRLFERLSSRARERAKPWPEYTELDCFSCHHSLTMPEQSWRQKTDYNGRRPGDPPWNASRYIVFRAVAHQVDPPAAQHLDDEMAKLAKVMSNLSPDREKVAALAASSSSVAEQLAGRISGMTFDQAQTLSLLRSISGNSQEIAGSGERSAEQAAMALDSLYLAYSASTKPGNEQDVRAAIRGLFQELQYPSSYDPGRFAAQMHKVSALLR
jgi:Cytochrome c554 and c-prime